jgi:hypothetical protein
MWSLEDNLLNLNLKRELKCFFLDLSQIFNKFTIICNIISIIYFKIVLQLI